MNEDQLRQWLKENLKLTVNTETNDHGSLEVEFKLEIREWYEGEYQWEEINRQLIYIERNRNA